MLNASGISAVIVAKADYVSLRVKFLIVAEPGHTALVVFPDGSQKNVTSSYQFEVFLPRTSFFVGSFSQGTAEEILISDQNPSDIAVVPNVDESFFSYYLSSESWGIATLYWFKIEGNARVLAAGYGVPI
jgi:hypothetical protein